MPILSNEQRETICTDIKKILAFSQSYSDGIPFNGVDKWLDTWEENKARFFYNLLHNQLVYEYGAVEFHVSEAHRRELLDNFISSICDSVAWDDNYTWKNFLEFTLNNRSTFFENTVGNSLFESYGAKLGMKFVKALKFFIPAGDLERVQNLASTYIQKDKCKGVLCFSIHPLDYLTASENGYNWRSCHALDGEYRAGNISYMLDSVTIVCYLRGEGDSVGSPRIPSDVKWNSKKWRMLLHINTKDTLAFAGRQYPFFSDSIFDYLDKFLFGIWNKFTDAQVQSVYLTSGDDNIIEPRLKTLPLRINDNWIFRTKPELIRNGKNNLAYNDLLNSSCYEPFYSVPIRHFMSDDIENLKIIVGRQVPCACCGVYPAAETSSFLCPQCHNSYEYDEDNEEEDTTNVWMCVNCGTYYNEDEEMFLDINGNPVCAHCINDSYRWCYNCEAWVWDNSVYVNEGVQCCPRCRQPLRQGE